MSELILAQSLVIVLLTAFVGGVFAKKLNLPILVGYLIGGMAIGSFAASYGYSEIIKNIAQIGVILLLFTIGLEFSLTKIKELGEVIILGSLVQILLTTGAILLLFPFFGFNFYESLFFGVTFSLSSTAVALKILSDKGELETLHGELSSGWLFMQDLYTLPLIILLSTIGVIMKGESSGIFALLTLSKSLVFAFISFSGIIFLGKHTVPFIIEKIADFRSRELVLVGAIFFCLLVAFIFELLGFSYALGAFVAGIILSSSSSHHGIFAEVRPLRDLFGTVFFVSLGFILNPIFLLSSLPKILVLAILVIMLKFIISFILVFLLGYHSKIASLVGFSLTSVGEFAFIIGMMGVSLQIISQEVFTMILSTSFITLIFSVPLLSHGDRIYYRVKGFLVKRFPFISLRLAKYERLGVSSNNVLSDHIVVLGHGRVGKYICKALSLTQIPYIVVDYNHKLVKTLRSQGIQVIYGDPAEIDVLEFANVRQAKVVILAYADRHTQEVVITNILTLNPKVTIICRTHFDEDQIKLRSLGVNAVVQPEFEAAVSITEKLLNLLYRDASQIEEKLRKLRTY